MISVLLDDEQLLEEKNNLGDLNEDAMFNEYEENYDEAAQIVEAVQFHFAQNENLVSSPKIGN